MYVVWSRTHADVKLAVDQDLRRVHVQRRERRLVRTSLHRRKLVGEPSLERLVLCLSAERLRALDLRPRLGEQFTQRLEHRLERVRDLQHHRRHGALLGILQRLCLAT